MKKHTLKRYLASLLAVLMLISVAGVSPAVFADDTTPPQLVETSANSPKEVLIKSTYSNEQVLNALAAALFTGADNDYAQTLNWTYKWAVKGKYKTSKYDPLEHDTNDAREATVSIFGETQTAKYYYTKRLHADATYTYPALKDQADGSYTLYLNGQTVYIKKVAKLTSSVSVANSSIDVALPYNADGSVNADLLHKLIFDAAGVTTTPEGLTYSDLSYSGDFSEGSNKTVTISYAGNDDYYGSSAPVTVNFTDSRAVAFELKDKPATLSIGYKGNLPNEEATLAKVRDQLVAKVGDVDLDQITVEYNIAFGKYVKLDLAAVLAHVLVATDIKLSYAGDATHKPFNKIVEDIKFADNRVDCNIAIKENASITYNMDAKNMKEQIFNNVIDWESENTKLPEGITVDDLTFECKPYATWKDIAGSEYPNLDAGDAQEIRISFGGDSDYKSGEFVFTIKVAKATVNVSMNKFSTAYAGVEEDLTREALGVTLDPNDTRIDVYMIFAGINTNLKTSVNLVLTDDQWAAIQTISKVQREIYNILGLTMDEYKDKPTLEDQLKDGITIGEFKAYVNEFITALEKASELPGVSDMLEKYNISISSLKAMASLFDKLTEFSDDTTIAFGVPQHAGLYRAYAVAVHKNYETNYTSGTVLILMNWKNMKIVPNAELKKQTITTDVAAEYADGTRKVATLNCGDTAVSDQSSLHYRYTGLNTIYSSHDFPTKAGKYIVTVSVRGGDYYALPTTFIFTIK